MINFRQKEFVAPFPLIATAGRIAASALPSLAVEGGLGLAANKSQEKANEEQTAIMQQQAAEQARANRNIQRTLNKIAESAKNNPQSALIGAGQTLQQRQYAINLGKASRIIKKEVGGFGKDLGKMVLSKKNTLIGGTIAGGAMAGTSYLADKAVQLDMKRNNIPLTATTTEESRNYSGLPNTLMKGVNKVGKTLKDSAKSNKGMILTTSAFGAMPILSSYAVDKQKLKDQVENTKSYSITGSILSGMKKGKASIKKGFNTFKSHPGQSILGFISNNIGQGGGRKDVMKFGRDLENLGKKSGSTLSQKTGRFIYNNPKTSLVGSTLVGMGVTANTWDRGEKAVKGIAKKLDKNAYAYQESKNQEIE